MSLLSVVQSVCAVVGVARPTAVFANINTDRTMFEMLELADEMATRIATDARDWTMLRNSAVLVGNGLAEAFPLPPTYRRMLTNGNVWRSTQTQTPMRFIPDTDEWLQRRAANYADGRGEWTIYGGNIHIIPIMDGGIADWANNVAYKVSDLRFENDSGPTFRTIWRCAVAHTSAAAGAFAADRSAHLGPPAYWVSVPNTTARFSYLDKNYINQHDPSTGLSLGQGDVFMTDTDTYRLDERILKLGMIWQWKANKGSPYAEDMGSYQDAIAWAMGPDSPAPILIGRLPISTTARMAYPFYPVPTP